MSASASNDRFKRRLKEVYDDYRTALLNRKYYGHRLVTARRANLAVDILLAVSAASAVGSWAIWRTPPGDLAWQIIASAAAIVAVARPFLRLTDTVERYSELFVGYGAIFHALRRLVADIRRTSLFTPDLEFTFRYIVERFRDLAPDDDPKPSSRLVRRYYKEVNNEIPPSSLWMPD